MRRTVLLLSRFGLCLAVSAAMAGCPREAQEPSPGDAPPCAVLADCNGGAACGEVPLRACVDDLCEETPSIIRPCSDAADAGP